MHYGSTRLARRAKWDVGRQWNHQKVGKTIARGQQQELLEQH